jgi:hypothetical protein
VTLARPQFLDRLRALHMTQRDFAEAAGISRAAVNHWGGPSHPGVPVWAEKLIEAWEREIGLIARLERAIERNAELAAQAELKRD